MTARVEELEDELATLRSRITKLEARERERNDDDGLIRVEYAPPTKRMGRRPLLSDFSLRGRLEYYLTHLEGLWSQYSEAIEQATSAEHLSELLLEKLPARDTDQTFQRLLACRDQMWEFVTSDRFNHTAEQLACAMAGVPEMKVRSSLDKCTRLLPDCDRENVHINIEVYPPEDR